MVKWVGFGVGLIGIEFRFIFFSFDTLGKCFSRFIWKDVVNIKCVI